jgi:hypothetical protein
MTAMGILQNRDFLYISNKYDVLPENIDPKMSSRYPEADEGDDGERGGSDDDVEADTGTDADITMYIK